MARNTTATGEGAAAPVGFGVGLEGALEARRAAWFAGLGEGLEAMRGRFDGFDPGRVGENEAFLDAVAELTPQALATHRPSRLEALRNIALNAAAGFTPDDPAKRMFMDLLGRYSDLHFQILRVINDPAAAPEVQARTDAIGSIEFVINVAFSEAASIHVRKGILADLTKAGLVCALSNTIFRNGAAEGRCITADGEALLRFISPPVALH